MKETEPDLKDILESLGQSFGKLKAVPAQFQGVSENVAGSLAFAGKAVGAFAAVAGGAVAAGTLLVNSFKIASSMFAGLIETGASLIIGPFETLGNALKKFVGALSPTTVAAWDFAMRNLVATIGVSLAPMMQALTISVRQMSGVILPMMEKLAPAMQKLGEAFGDVFVAVVEEIVTIFTALVPLLDFFAGALKAVAEIFQMAGAFWKAFFEVLMEGLGGGLKGALDGFRDAIHLIMKSTMMLYAFIARIFGQTGFLDKLADNSRKLSEGDHGQGAFAAPMGARITGFESIGKDFATAAFAAMGAGGAGGQTDREIWKEIADAVTDIKDGKIGNFDALGKALVNAVAEKYPLLAQVLEAVFNWLSKIPTLDSTRAAIEDSLRRNVSPVASVGFSIWEMTLRQQLGL